MYNMNILVVSSNYPSPQAPQVGTFVYELVQKFVKFGNRVAVVSPQKVYFRRRSEVYGEELAEVYRPKKVSFSNRKIWRINTFHLSMYFQARAIRNTLARHSLQPEVVYCHFIISALNYYQAFPDSKVAVFVAVGEYRNIDVIRRQYSPESYANVLKRITGFIAVSPQVQVKLLSLGVPGEKILVEPNAVDRALFRPLDKKQCRKKFGLPEEKKIILFVGRFLHDKGPLRVLEAINRLPEDVVGVFVGRGPQVIEGAKVVFKATLLHHEVPEMMNAADVFVLPTLHEGSSNVIVEAMACGLPIISSNLPEIQVQCDSSFSILVNPLDVDEIERAIKAVVQDEEVLKEYSKWSLIRSERFDLEQRAARILKFIKSSLL